MNVFVIAENAEAFDGGSFIRETFAFTLLRLFLLILKDDIEILSLLFLLIKVLVASLDTKLL